MEAAYRGGPRGRPVEGRRRSRAGWWASLFVVLLAVLAVLVFFIGRNADWWGAPTDIKVPAVKGDTVARPRPLSTHRVSKTSPVQDEPSTT